MFATAATELFPSVELKSTDFFYKKTLLEKLSGTCVTCEKLCSEARINLNKNICLSFFLSFLV
jgi:hypothetical protein